VIPFGCPLWIVLILVFLYGAVLGSFLNVCIYRIPQKENLWVSLKGLGSPPSYCPGCKNHISPLDNIPVIGWLKLGGRCRFCDMRISVRYPLIEFFNGLIFAVVYWLEIPGHYGANITDGGLYSILGPQGLVDSFWLSPTAILHWRYAYHIVLLEALIVATFIDIDIRIIPDGSTLPAMAVGVLCALAIGQVHLAPLWFQEPSLVRSTGLILPDWLNGLLNQPANVGRFYVPQWITAHSHWHGLLVSITGLAVGGGIVWAVRLIGFWVLRQEAMGFGDVVLMACIGAFFGWQPTVVVFFIAPVCAIVVVAGCWIFWQHREIPYGPYLSSAALIVIIGWKQIWPIAERLFAFGPIIIVLAMFMGVMLIAILHLVQLLKRMLGIPLYPDPWIEEWTSADQLAHFSGETIEFYQGHWQPELCEEWLGIPSGRGTAHEQIWRRGCRCHTSRDWHLRQSEM